LFVLFVLEEQRTNNLNMNPFFFPSGKERRRRVQVKDVLYGSQQRKEHEHEPDPFFFVTRGTRW